jgi:hypothetical protein
LGSEHGGLDGLAAAIKLYNQDGAVYRFFDGKRTRNHPKLINIVLVAAHLTDHPLTVDFLIDMRRLLDAVRHDPTPIRANNPQLQHAVMLDDLRQVVGEFAAGDPRPITDADLLFLYVSTRRAKKSIRRRPVRLTHLKRMWDADAQETRTRATRVHTQIDTLAKRLGEILETIGGAKTRVQLAERRDGLLGQATQLMGTPWRPTDSDVVDQLDVVFRRMGDLIVEANAALVEPLHNGIRETLASVHKKLDRLPPSRQSAERTQLSRLDDELRTLRSVMPSQYTVRALQELAERAEELRTSVSPAATEDTDLYEAYRTARDQREAYRAARQAGTDLPSPVNFFTDDVPTVTTGPDVLSASIELAFWLPKMSSKERKDAIAAIAGEIGDLYEAGAATAQWVAIADGHGVVLRSPQLSGSGTGWAQLPRVIEIARRHGGVSGGYPTFRVPPAAGQAVGDLSFQVRLLQLMKATEDTLFRLAGNTEGLTDHSEHQVAPDPVPPEGYTLVTKAHLRNPLRASNAVTFHKSSGTVWLEMWHGTLDPGVLQARLWLSLGLVRAAADPGLAERLSDLLRRGETLGYHHQRDEDFDEQHELERLRELLDLTIDDPRARRQVAQVFGLTDWQPPTPSRFGPPSRWEIVEPEYFPDVFEDLANEAAASTAAPMGIPTPEEQQERLEEIRRALRDNEAPQRLHDLWASLGAGVGEAAATDIALWRESLRRARSLLRLPHVQAQVRAFVDTAAGGAGKPANEWFLAIESSEAKRFGLGPKQTPTKETGESTRQLVEAAQRLAELKAAMERAGRREGGSHGPQYAAAQRAAKMVVRHYPLLHTLPSVMREDGTELTDSDALRAFVEADNHLELMAKAFDALMEHNALVTIPAENSGATETPTLRTQLIPTTRGLHPLDLSATILRALGDGRSEFVRSTILAALELGDPGRASEALRNSPHFGPQYAPLIAYLLTEDLSTPDDESKAGYEAAITEIDTLVTSLQLTFHRSLEGLGDLVAGVKSGIETRTNPSMGWSTMVERVTFYNGTKAIYKTGARAMSGRLSTSNVMVRLKDADAEQLAALVGKAVGAPVPAVYRTSEFSVYMEFIEGGTYTESRAVSSIPTLQEYAETDAGRLIGLMDVIVGNYDRYPGNIMITPLTADLVGIDHGLAWDHGLDLRNDGSVRPPKGLSTPFVDPYITVLDADNTDWVPKNDMSPHDMAIIEQRLLALRDDFVLLGRLDWWEAMIARFREIKKRAKGTRNRLPQ